MYRPSAQFRRTNASHVYVSDGTWAFDHDGWTLESELLRVTRATEPQSDFRPRPIHMDLDTFCVHHHHRSRKCFAFDHGSGLCGTSPGFPPRMPMPVLTKPPK